MKHMHSVEILLESIQNHFHTDYLFDVNLSIHSKTHSSMDIEEYIRSTGRSSLYNRLSCLFNYEQKYSVNIFYFSSSDNTQTVKQIDFGTLSIGNVLNQLNENSGFFNDADMWAITMLCTSYSNAHPEVYAFIM